ncbi:MAG: hypothetical protein ACRDTJ_02520 [Pseudonocardiaceae bacterium]
MSPDDPRHGTLAGHAEHRRIRTPNCAACRRAKATYEQMRLVAGGNKIPSLGTQRRIQALRARGWSSGQLAARGGWKSSQAFDFIALSEVCSRATAARVKRLYDALADQEPPPGPRVKWLRDRAAAKGWALPGAWLDIDDPDEIPDSGSDGRMSTAEKYAEVQWLLSLGVSKHEALKRVGWSRTAMERYLERGAKDEAA